MGVNGGCDISPLLFVNYCSKSLSEGIINPKMYASLLLSSVKTSRIVYMKFESTLTQKLYNNVSHPS